MGLEEGWRTEFASDMAFAATVAAYAYKRY
jgi:hypothetical protein